MQFKKLMKRVVAGIATCATIFTLFAPVTAVAARPADSIDVSLTYGYNGFLETETYAPFTVDLKNNGSDFSGSVWILIPVNDSEVVGYETKVSLAAGASKSISRTVKVQAAAENCLIRLTDHKGRTVQEKKIKLQFRSGITQARVGILSDDYNALSPLSGFFMTGLSSVQYLTTKLSENNILEDPLALDTFHVIILTDYSSDRLTEKQRKAIVDWTAAGGLLIVGTGTGASKVLKGFPELSAVQTGDLHTYKTLFGETVPLKENYYWGNDYIDYSDIAIVISELAKAVEPEFFEREEYTSLPSMDEKAEYFLKEYKDKIYETYWYYLFRDTHSFMIKYYTPDEVEKYEETLNYEFVHTLYPDLLAEYAKKDYSKQHSTTAKETPESEYYTAHVCDLLSGSPLLYAETSEGNVFPLANLFDYGNGNICVFSTDISKPPFVDSFVFEKRISEAVLHCIGGELYDLYSNGGTRYQRNNSYEDIRTADNIGVGNLLPIPAYFLIFGVYIVIAFVSYFVLKKRKKTIYLWAVQPALAVTATILVLFVSLTTRISQPTINAIKFSEVTENLVNEKMLACAILPKNKKYTLRFDAAHTPNLLQERTYNYYNSTTNTEITDYNIGWLDEEDCNAVSLYANAALAKQDFSFTGTSDHSVLNLKAHASYSDYKLTGYFTNNGTATLENCSVFTGLTIYPLGTVTPGETVDLSQITPVSVFREYEIYPSVPYIVEQLSGRTTGFAYYMFGFKNNDFKKYFLHYHALVHLFDNDSGMQELDRLMRLERNVSTAMGGYYYGRSTYYGKTRKEIFEDFGLNEQGIPEELNVTPYFIGFNADKSNSIVTKDSHCSENIVEIVYMAVPLSIN